MSGVRWRASYDQYTSPGPDTVVTRTYKKAILLVTCPSNRHVLIPEFDISFAGIAPTDPPILVTLQEAGSLGTPTESNQVPAKLDPNDPTPESTFFWDCDTSDQPSFQKVLWAGYIHPQSGRTVRRPKGEEWILYSDGIIVLTVTSTVSVPVQAAIYGEE